MADIIVRPARPEDKAAWRDMRAALYGEDPSLLTDVEGYFAGDPMIAAAFIAEHGKPLDHDEFGLSQSKLINVIDSHMLARDSCEKPAPTFSHPALGFIELSLRNYAEGCASSPVPYVEGLYVGEGQRRQNVGRLLVAAAEDWAKQRGFTEMASDTQIENEASLGAHRAYGFAEVERIACLRKRLD